MLENLHIPYGVVSRSHLLDVGVSSAEIARAYRRGDLITLRRGWYAAAHADPDPDVVAAVTAGGVLSCVSALRRHGVWVPPTGRRTHMRANASMYRRTPERFCRGHGPLAPECGPVDDLPTALRHALSCLDDEGIVVVCDSILHQELLEPYELTDAFACAPGRIRALLDQCDARADSGTESITRFRLRRQRIRVQVQPFIPGVGLVDLLVGDWLILEMDSVTHHTGSAEYENDRRRDREATRQGYMTMRLTYHEVLHNWPTIRGEIMDIVRQRRHQRRERSERAE